MNDLMFTNSDEWVKVEDNKAYIGISNYAQEQLGDIVYVDLPTVGTKLNAGDSMGAIESVKAAADLYSPVSGEIVEVNNSLSDMPEKLNTEAEKTFIVIVKIDKTPDNLMNRDEYMSSRK